MEGGKWATQVNRNFKGLRCPFYKYRSRKNQIKQSTQRSASTATKSF